MPTVPRIQRQVGPQPLPQARRAARLTPTAAGVARYQAETNVGEALQQVGYTTGIFAARYERQQQEAAARVRDDANRTAVMKLKNKADVWKRANIYAPNTGYLAVNGENALLLPEKAQQDLKQFGADIQPDINTPEQRQAWDEIYADLQDSTMLTVYRHTTGEQQKVMVGEATARVSNAQSLAIAAVQDPYEMVKQIGAGMRAVDELGRLEGWGKDKTDEAKYKFGSNVNVGAIHALVAAGQNEKARTLFNTARRVGAIEGEQIADLVKLLDTEDLTAKAQQEFDKLDQSGMSVDEQREAAKLLEPKLRPLVNSLIMQEVSNDATAEAAAIKARDKEIYQILVKNPSLGAIPSKWRKDFGSAEGTHWNSVIANIRASQETGGPPSPYAKVSKPTVLAYLANLAQTDPAAFAKLPLERPNWVASLSKEDYEQALRGRGAAAAGEEKRLADIMGGEFTFQNAWSAALGENNMKENDPRVSEIMGKVRQDGRVMALDPARKGKPLTTADWELIMKRNLIQHTLAKPWYQFDVQKSGYQIHFDDIPVEAHRDLVESINFHNPQNPVTNMRTDARMVEAYRAKLFKDAQKTGPPVPPPGVATPEPARPSSPATTYSPTKAPGLTQAGNIDLRAQPRVQNKDGSVSTVRSMSIEEDGIEILIPTVAHDGSGILGAEAAIEQYHRTGKHLGKFKTVAAADAYAKWLHEEYEAGRLERQRVTTPRLQGPR